MKVLQILQFVGLIAERIMFWKKNNKTTNNEAKKANWIEKILHYYCTSRKCGILLFMHFLLYSYKYSIFLSVAWIYRKERSL